MNRRGSVLIIVAIVIIVILLAVLGWLIYRNATSQPAAVTPQSAPSPTSTIVYLPNGTPFGVFPTGLPIDGNVQVLQNFRTNNPPQNVATSTQAEQQSVYEYVTTLSLGQAYSDYSQYFANNGWQVISSLNQTTTKAISAENRVVEVSVTLSTNSITQKNSVNLVATYEAPYSPPGAQIEVSSTPQLLQKYK